MAKSTYSTYNKQKKKAKKNRGLHKHSYSDFWLNDRYDYLSKYEQKEEDNSAAVYTKAVRLFGYQRAIGNFVKIVTNKDIPVRFAGSTSYTNGEAVTISADIKDKTFDVSVGLALHEASHITLSNMKYWTDYLTTYSQNHTKSEYALFKSLTNWLEDRRIDNKIFKQSPGYKAYYHKLYDYYWNDDVINKALLSNDYRDPQNREHWLFNIINSISPFFNVNRMTGLKEVMDVLNVQNIDRLTCTEDVIKVVEAAVDILNSYIPTSLDVQDDKQQDNSTDINNDSTKQTDNKDTTQQDNKDIETGGEEGGGEEGGGEEVDSNFPQSGTQTQSFKPTELLDANDRITIERVFKKQQDLVNNNVNKTNVTNDLAEPLNAFDGQGGKLIQLEDAFISNRTKRGARTKSAGKRQNAPGYFTDLTKAPMYNAYVDILQKEFLNGDTVSDKDKWGRRTRVTNELRKINSNLANFMNYCENRDYVKAIGEGLTLGGLVANKLRTHGESRDRVDNRQLTGALDRRRIAHLGYGVESVFQRINIQRNKPAHIHLTIDGSGSMQESDKWTATIRLAVAMARGIQGKPNLSMSVSVRVQAGDLFRSSNKTLSQAPAIAIVWDSRSGMSTQGLGAILSNISFSSYTPEGLCYDILAKSGYITPGSDTQDSYLVNISDGCPNWGNHYDTNFDYHHHHCKENIYTNKWWKKCITKYNMVGLSYFIHCRSGVSEYTKRAFTYMYGNDAVTIDTNNAMQVATTINKMLIQSTSNVLV